MLKGIYFPFSLAFIPLYGSLKHCLTQKKLLLKECRKDTQKTEGGALSSTVTRKAAAGSHLGVRRRLMSKLPFPSSFYYECLSLDFWTFKLSYGHSIWVTFSQFESLRCASFICSTLIQNTNAESGTNLSCQQRTSTATKFQDQQYSVLTRWEPGPYLQSGGGVS